MNYPDGAEERFEVFLSGNEAEDFCSARWREPVAEELEELASLIATNYVNSSVRLFDEEFDDIEILIRISREKENILKDIKGLTRVLEFPVLNASVFYVFLLLFSKGEKSNALLFEDGLSRFLKKDGVLVEMNKSDDYLFEV